MPPLEVLVGLAIAAAWVIIAAKVKPPSRGPRR